MILKLTRQLLLFSILICTWQAKAQEAAFYGGLLSHTATGGSSKSSGTKLGVGALVRFDLSAGEELELQAYSDRRWTEGNILKPFYVFGRRTQHDRQNDIGVSARTVSNNRLISSVGVGYFSHNTNEKVFNLPTLVTGLNLKNMNTYYYAVSERLSVVGIVSINFSLSTGTQSVLMGAFAGVAYDF